MSGQPHAASDGRYPVLKPQVLSPSVRPQVRNPRRKALSAASQALQPTHRALRAPSQSQNPSAQPQTTRRNPP
eukprot:CAMPEP_0114116966 /NCGR_PEP_ID=MMETSP0043_2-20121206/4779_1 /TAXON_ID=464988 /ORGANISM="Hemiselmis andersenii, Strain CCMP644" /LENGTH=72 /DNA_ID=CAMNT_0001209321 /DNA_START=73 /DNA_END=287 /DNA_ORIENTATION=-